MDYEDKDKTFVIHWLDGKSTIIYGENIEKAFNKSYGAGAVRAIDYYEEIKEKNK